MEKEIKSFTKYAMSFDEDFKLSDFTPAELDQILKSRQKTNRKFKDDYFAFYDDVKSSSLKKQDW